MTTALSPIAHAESAAAGWLASHDLIDAHEQICDWAEGTALALTGHPRDHDQFAVGPQTAFVSLQPGDGTKYDMVLTLLPADVTDSLGYGLVVAFPHFGAVLALDPAGFHVPWYVQEKAPQLGPLGHAAVAAFLTVLSAHIDRIRMMGG
jgi:hypothetical protein